MDKPRNCMTSTQLSQSPHLMVLSLSEPFRWACNSNFGSDLQNLSCCSV